MKSLSLLFLSLLITGSSYAQDAGGDWRTSFSTVAEHLRQEMDVEDKSADSAIFLPMPRFAYVNIKGTMSLPTAKTTKRNAWLEMYDGKGHYFKKRIVITAQGNYTLRLEKKSYNFDLSDNDWDLTSQPQIAFGNWVDQDGFLLKGFYTDAIRGISEVGYNLFEEVVEDRKPFWEREGYKKESDARCFPDGFPCAVYFNGDFLGLYSWQLKKSRKNMNMKKHTAEHIHIDGDIRDEFFFGGNISWEHFDVRNPKDIYTKTDTEYDGNSPDELMGDDSPYLSTTESADHMKDLIRTIKVKNYIIGFSKCCGDLKELDNRGVSETEFKAEFERHYEVQSLLDYYVFNRMTMNLDGMLKNWQWFTYNGNQWMVAPYDLDMTFGVTLYGFPVPVERSKSYITQGPYVWMDKYYSEQERERYIELRQKGVFDVANIHSLLDDWCDRIGEEYYALEKARWPESPCYNDIEISPNWELYEDWENFDKYKDYNPFKTYKAGDICLYQSRLWRATDVTVGVEPPIRNAGKDDLQRIKDWVVKRIDYMDAFYGYDPVSVRGITTDSLSECSEVVGIYSLTGMPIKASVGGVNIYRYSDGTARKVVRMKEN